jgi:hypothetical protein
MPSFRTGVVTELLVERPGLQRVHVDLGAGPEPSYVLTQLTGPVAAGDRVVVNTAAVELGLGTGGWHVVHWNLARDEWKQPSGGHLMKVRYTSLQADVASAEECHPEIAEVGAIDAMPVVVASLHSQLAPIAVAIKHARPAARVVYVMTDGASLPIAISDLVHELCTRSLLDATITCGQAFGGDHDAISLQSALAIARVIEHADITVVAMGPGSAGTATRLGFSGIELGATIDAVAGLGGTPIVALRFSAADPRTRHRGISHHTTTALTTATRTRAVVAIPDELDADDSAIAARHDIVRVPTVGIIELLAAHGLRVESMGRAAADDPWLFECAAAAGIVAVDRIT